MTVAAHAGRLLRCAAGAVLLTLLIVAPLNFASTRPGGAELLTTGCALATLLWFFSCALPGHRPQVPAPVACLAALFVLATLPWLTGLATATPVSPFTQTHFARLLARWPVSLVWRDATNALPLAIALVAVMLPLTDLARDARWALLFSTTLVAIAVFVGLLALIQNHTHATGIYWRDDGRMPGNFCGTFFHHTAAGAYFNTAWPLAFAFTWLAWKSPRLSLRGHGSGAISPATRPEVATSVSEWTRSPRLFLAGVLASIILLAAHGSHVSRFPQAAALLVASFFLLRLLRSSQFPAKCPLGASLLTTSRSPSPSEAVATGGTRPLDAFSRAPVKPTRPEAGFHPKLWLLLTACVAAIVLLVALGGRTADMSARWQLLITPARSLQLPTRPPESAWPALMRDDLFVPFSTSSGWLGDRTEGWRTALRSIADRPLTGHGPANWMGAASQHTTDPFVRTFFQFVQFTHQDLLQAAVEWGVPAALAWWGLLAGSVLAVFRARHWRTPAHRALGLAAAAGLTALLLQCQLDFPLQFPALAFQAVVLAALGWAGVTPPVYRMG